MRWRWMSSLLVALVCARQALAIDVAVQVNPAIDMPGFLRIAADAAAYRETHRLSEQQFIAMSRADGTVVLDARSREKYDQLHVKGALNLPFPDIAIGSLERLLPDKDARILIYCNNNFLSAPAAFPSKLPSASLNLSTYIALYDYGYRNVYELGPLIDIDSSLLEFEPPLRRPLSDSPESARIRLYAR